MVQAEVEQFVAELDAAMQAHLQWNRRVLRCSILRTSPGDDVLTPDAHTLCHFGRWFRQNKGEFQSLDSTRAEALESEHQAMHDAIRSICTRVLQGSPGETPELDTFDLTQTRLIEHLGYFKTLAVARSSLVDALTGLPMRHRIGHDYDLLRKHVGRRARALLVLMADVDHFKGINDRHGHDGGDAVLRSLAHELRAAVRKDDQVYRYGGEEFLLLMSLSDPDHAAITTEKLIETMRGLSIVLPDGEVVQPTITVGAALAQADESLAEVIRRADLALYAGKASGRNRWVIAPASQAPDAQPRQRALPNSALDRDS
jgi:diguanylate cyclase